MLEIPLYLSWEVIEWRVKTKRSTLFFKNFYSINGSERELEKMFITFFVVTLYNQKLPFILMMMRNTRCWFVLSINYWHARILGETSIWYTCGSSGIQHWKKTLPQSYQYDDITLMLEWRFFLRKIIFSKTFDSDNHQTEIYKVLNSYLFKCV